MMNYEKQDYFGIGNLNNEFKQLPLLPIVNLIRTNI